MDVCDVWLARDFLRRHGRPVDIPPGSSRPPDPTTEEQP